MSMYFIARRNTHTALLGCVGAWDKRGRPPPVDTHSLRRRVPSPMGAHRLHPQVCPARAGSLSMSRFKISAPPMLSPKQVQCMEAPGDAPPAPTDELLYATLKDIIEAIPDMEAVTIKQLRQRASQHHGLGENGLEGRKEQVSEFAKMIIKGTGIPEFDAGGKRVAIAHAPEGHAAFAEALAATQGVVLRKKAKPGFAPSAEPQVDLESLPLRPWQGHNPVKAVVDVVRNQRLDLSEDDIKRSLLEGDSDDLPAVAKTPIGAFAVNHCVQVAFLPSGETFTVVRFVFSCLSQRMGK